MSRVTSRAKILFVYAGSEQPRGELRSTARYASALGADVYVLRIVGQLTRTSMLFPHAHLLEAVQVVEQTSLRRRRAINWVRSVLGDDWNDSHLALGSGDPFEQALTFALQLDADMIVIPATARRLGERVCRLARESRVPVLVVRSCHARGVIVAATDMLDATYPVVARAAHLARYAGNDLHVVHNVAPIDFSVGGAPYGPVAQVTDTEVYRHREDALNRVCRSTGQRTSTAVRDELNHGDAILRAGHDCNAETIVVGTRSRPWYARAMRTSVAAGVVDAAERSVLVAPIEQAPRLLNEPIEADASATTRAG